VFSINVKAPFWIMALDEIVFSIISTMNIPDWDLDANSTGIVNSCSIIAGWENSKFN